MFSTSTVASDGLRVRVRMRSAITSGGAVDFMEGAGVSGLSSEAVPDGLTERDDGRADERHPNRYETTDGQRARDHRRQNAQSRERWGGDRVLDLRRDAILDVTKVKKNVEKVRELFDTLHLNVRQYISEDAETGDGGDASDDDDGRQR